MKNLYLLAVLLFFSITSIEVQAQCSTTNATSCVCEQNGQTNCDLLPDITVSWVALENYANGPSEYPQSGAGSNNGRLRVTGSTPNIGHGPLNVRGVDQNGYRWFLCGTDTVSIYDPNSNTGFTCNNGNTAQQIIVQRIYHKNGNTMTFSEKFAGTMTYHPSHGHGHVDDWVTFTLRTENVNDPNPLNWPILGDGAKVGFCLMDFYSCTSGSASGHCRTSQEYGGGTPLNSAGDFDNFGLGGGNYGCSPVSQGLTVGYTDVYSENLDGMWIDIPPGTCNGDYWIIIEVDSRDDWVEEDETNNWSAMPFTLTQQVPGGGNFAMISPDGPTDLCTGASVGLTATAGSSYLWSTGETTQTINVNSAGTYNVTVTGQCGVDQSDDLIVSVVAPIQPVGTGATLYSPGSAALSATGSSVNWYDLEFGGSWLASGNNYNTPVIASTTSYWADEQASTPIAQSNTAKPDNAGGGGFYSNNQSLIFTADQEFALVSVRMYAGSAGNRHIVCSDDAGNLIAETNINLVSGEQIVPLNFYIPAGTDHEITIADDDGTGTAFIRDIYRNNNGVSYPYPIAGFGTITISTAGNSYYYFFYDWVVENIPVICTTARTEVVATVTETVSISAVVMLDGPYDDGSGLMVDDLRSATLLPTSEPFTGLGFTHVNGGAETIDAGVFDVTGNDAIIDWIYLELRDKNNNTNVLDTRSALVQRDGDVVDMDGVSPVVFSLMADDYFVAVKHRNHLGFMTNNVMALSNAPAGVDFSNSSVTLWGIDALKNINGTWCMWMGNTFIDGQVIYTGSNNDRDLILSSIGGIVPTATVSGYLNEDCNLDGVVKYTGLNNDRDPILINIGGAVPTNSKQEQLP